MDIFGLNASCAYKGRIVNKKASIQTDARTKIKENLTMFFFVIASNIL
jgi:hypothetical protein